MSTELYVVSAHSELGRLVDPDPILEGIRSAQMHALEAADIAIHRIGLFLTEGVGKGAPAVGYVACKGIYAESAEPEGALAEVGQHGSGAKALIGSLYLLDRYRGRGIGQLLAGEITTRTFAKYPGLIACVANCNSLSGSAFQSVGYMPGARLQSGKIIHEYKRVGK